VRGKQKEKEKLQLILSHHPVHPAKHKINNQSVRPQKNILCSKHLTQTREEEKP